FKNKALEGDVLTSDVVLYAKWAEKSAVQVSDYSGNIEAAFIEWKTVKDATGYEVYSKPANASDAAYVQVDSELVRQVSTGYRADILGLAAGNYTIKIVPLYGEEEGAPAFEDVVVEAYDRSGYAHFNYTDGVGAYNDDGTLKDNAIVLYVTDENKNTVTLTCGNTTVAGIGNILNSVGQRCGEPGHENECKRTSGTKTYYAEANGNEGILLKLSQAGIPLVVRFIGCVSNTGLYKAGTFNANSTPLIEGLTKYDSYDWGGSVGDNGHMARMKSGKNITLEGVGEDAVIDGWGFHFMAETSGPDYGKSFEVRNLTFINTPEDAIGMEGIQSGNQITASVERCWIHNNEFYGPHISSPAESDKGEGDGSCDFKRGQYLTVSYNYFEGCHKTNLVGSSDSSLQFNLTYHHNYWKLCKARGPLSRQANIHMYNNVFDGQTDFAMNTRANAYIFSEYNLFYMAKNPHRVDSGAIKSYHDSFSSCIGEMGGTIVTDKSQKVANNCQYAGGGIDYSEFDTNPALSYIPTGNYQLQTSITEARKVIEAKGGVKKDHRTNASDVTMSSISYLNGTTPEKISSMPTTLNPGKFTKKSFAFTIDRMASVNVQYATDSDDKTGVLINE
ncbi:MAG: hypothetical protein K2K15_00890, partial [Anaeroplasmataceae bacterium]|nr:hypothetical protein [Anaeroplasmataceae bacterium]